VNHRFTPYSEADQRCVHQTRTEIAFGVTLSEPCLKTRDEHSLQ